MRKILSFAPFAFALVGIGLLASCGGNDNKESNSDKTEPIVVPSENEDNTGEVVPGEATEYVFEAEYTDLTGILGGGISGAQGGTGMIVDAPKASNQLAVGYLHKKGVKLTFKITAEEDCTAKMVLGLGNELGAMKFNKTSYIISVNGTPLNYKEFTVKKNSLQTGTEFLDYKITPELSLTKGENIITFETGENSYCNGASGGPIFDCIKLTSTTKLSYIPLEDNI